MVLTSVKGGSRIHVIIEKKCMRWSYSMCQWGSLDASLQSKNIIKGDCNLVLAVHWNFDTVQVGYILLPKLYIENIQLDVFCVMWDI